MLQYHDLPSNFVDGSVFTSDYANQLNDNVKFGHYGFNVGTEADPTVPGWVKDSSKPSYKLLELSDYAAGSAIYAP